ncbi:hypothetical protein HUV60_029870 [Streptomyces sp. KMM 9044]|nr:histidine kinase dimerization/phospho-acceptor domain-containing protein [Streptomyces sp. KMM 9044]WAX81235.1 hypothetical protein HUV60_029870 [Streptomyces sp. KMM 9044]
MNEVPAGWRIVRLADVLSEPMVNGRSPRPGEGGLPVLRMPALRAATVDFTQSKSSDRRRRRPSAAAGSVFDADEEVGGDLAAVDWAGTHLGPQSLQLDRAKTTFFSSISHEFRTPLTLIMGPVEELRTRFDGGDSRAPDELEAFHRNGLRPGKLVNSLLDFSDSAAQFGERSRAMLSGLGRARPACICDAL